MIHVKQHNACESFDAFHVKQVGTYDRYEQL